jgi:hypothetical protein
MARPQWKSTLSGMARRSLTLFGPASFADVDGYVGTWVLNTGKSHFDPGPPIKSETLIVTDAGNGLLHVLDAETFGDGTSDHLEWSTMLNGAKNPVSGGSDVDSVTERMTKLSTYKAVFRKAGHPVTWETAHITSDGKTMHSFMHGKSPDGTPWKYHLVFDRQR